MKFEKFEETINLLKQIDEDTKKFNDLGLELFDLPLIDSFHKIIDNLFTEIYGKEGVNWIGWYCYENDFGDGDLKAWGDGEEEICSDVKSLWEYLEKECSQ